MDAIWYPDKDKELLPFDKDMEKIEEDEIFDSKSFIDNFIRLLENLNKLSVPLRYERATQV